jgi:hypothetical protein
MRSFDMKSDESDDNADKYMTIHDKYRKAAQRREPGMTQISLFDLSAERHAQSILGILLRRTHQSTVSRSGENEGSGI